MNDFDADSRLLHRYRALRRPDLQQNLIARHRMTQAARGLLCERGFLELETPMLVAPQAAEAHEFLVLSARRPDVRYALTQSAQLPHQLLMVAGYDRCFQFARRFRDEPSLPESTQLDFEMSFAGLDDLIKIGEDVLAAIAAGCDRTTAVDSNLPRLTHAEAVQRYGSAQPDLRFDMELKTIPWRFVAGRFRSTAAESDVLRALPVTGFRSEPLQDILGRLRVREDERVSYCIVCDRRISGPFAKEIDPSQVSDLLTSLGLDREPNAVLFLGVGEEAKVSSTLGQLRERIAAELRPPDHDALAFLWVTEFPWFELDSKTGGLSPAFNAFAMPLAADLPKLSVRPELVRSSKFELILNGAQLASGSLRIHQAALQKRMLEVLDISPEDISRRYGALLDALQHGAPPHGGMSIDYDQLVMRLLGAASLDQVIAFPTSSGAAELADDPDPSTH